MAKPKVQVLVDWNNDGDFLDAYDDITADITDMRLDHLRDFMSEYMNGAVLDLVLNNDDHKYSPPNGASPLTGNLVTGRRVWVRAWYPFDSFVHATTTFLFLHSPENDSSWTWVSKGAPGYFRVSAAGAAYMPDAASALDHLDFGDSDVTISTNFSRGTDTTDHGGLLLRYVNNSNFAYVVVTGTALELRKVIAGVDTLVNSTAHTWAVSTTKYLVVELHGTYCRIFVDGTEITDTTLNDAAINSATKHGLYAANACDHTWLDFGGYRSLFSGKIAKIRPRPGPGSQYCYLQAMDAFETAKTQMVRYHNYLSTANPNIGDTLGVALGSLNLDGSTWAKIFRQFDTGTLLVQDANSGTATENVGMKSVVSDLLSVIYQFQDEEDGLVYIDGQGFLRAEARGHRVAAPHTTSKATYKDAYDGSNPAFTDLAWDDGVENIENYIVAKITRATITASQVLYTNEQAASSWVSVYFTASEVKDFLIEVNDFDGVLAWTTPVATTDYTANANADGSGADQTGAITVAYADVTNISGKYRRVRVTWGGTAGYLTKLQLRGTSIAYEDPTAVEALDSTSISTYGERSKTINCLFLDRYNDGYILCTHRLARRKDPKTTIDLTLKAGDKVTLHHMIQRHISDRVTVSYSDMGISEAFYIEGESWSFEEGGTRTEQTLQLRGVT